MNIRQLAGAALLAAGVTIAVAPPVLADNDDPHREVVCHREGNGSYHAIPPAQASAHLPKHEKDFVLKVSYDPKVDGKWNDVKERYDALCNQTTTPTETTTTSSTSTSTSSTTTTSTSTSTTSSPDPDPTTDPPVIGIPISDGVKCDELGRTIWEVAYGDLSDKPFKLRVSRDGVSVIENYPAGAMAEWTFIAPVTVQIEQRIGGVWYNIVTPFEVEEMNCPQPTTSTTTTTAAPSVSTTTAAAAPVRKPAVRSTVVATSQAAPPAELAMTGFNKPLSALGLLCLLGGSALLFTRKRIGQH